MKRMLMWGLVLLSLMLGHDALAFYNPSTGRWLSRDPIVEAGGKNLFAFVRNNSIQNWDGLGLRRGGPVKLSSLSCYCCECAEDIWLSKIVPYEKSPFNGNPASFFQVNILLSYRTVQLPREPQAPIYKWEEKSNRPSPAWIDSGAKPGEWNDLFALDPSAISANWTGRNTTCEVNQLTRIVLDGDEPTADPAKGYRYIQFRLSVVNPPECKCPNSVVQVTATQTFEPSQNPPMNFQTP